MEPEAGGTINLAQEDSLSKRVVANLSGYPYHTGRSAGLWNKTGSQTLDSGHQLAAKAEVLARMSVLCLTGLGRRDALVLVFRGTPGDEGIGSLTGVGKAQVVKAELFEIELDRTVGHDGADQVAVGVGFCESCAESR